VVPPLHCLVLVNLFMFASSRRRGLIQVGSTTEFSQVVVLDLCSFGLLEIFVVFFLTVVGQTHCWVSLLTAVCFGPIITWFCA
jgi:hypothetical protein